MASETYGRIEQPEMMGENPLESVQQSANMEWSGKVRSFNELLFVVSNYLFDWLIFSYRLFLGGGDMLLTANCPAFERHPQKQGRRD